MEGGTTDWKWSTKLIFACFFSFFWKGRRTSFLLLVKAKFLNQTPPSTAVRNERGAKSAVLRHHPATADREVRRNDELKGCQRATAPKQAKRSGAIQSIAKPTAWGDGRVTSNRQDARGGRCKGYWMERNGMKWPCRYSSPDERREVTVWRLGQRKRSNKVYLFSVLLVAPFFGANCEVEGGTTDRSRPAEQRERPKGDR